jgi:hypothetical protein
MKGFERNLQLIGRCLQATRGEERRHARRTEAGSDRAGADALFTWDHFFGPGNSDAPTSTI